MVGETLRAALEALAAAAPTWLSAQLTPELTTRYAARIDEWRLPGDQAKRRQLGAQIGADGWRLLQAMAGVTAPGWLWQIPAVQVLRQIWVQQYTLDAAGQEVIWRDATTHGLPPGENHAAVALRHRRAAQPETRPRVERLQGPPHRNLRQHRHQPRR